MERAHMDTLFSLGKHAMWLAEKQNDRRDGPGSATRLAVTVSEKWPPLSIGPSYFSTIWATV